MKVPFNDLSILHKPLIDKFEKSISEIIKSNAFVSGKYVTDFEEKFAYLNGVKHCISVSNGTVALWMSLKALGITEGDEVILPANTFIACSEAVRMCNATPVFVDNDEFFNIDTSKIINNISSKTKAIIAVHLYGQMADIKKIKELCSTYNLLLIEDCSQSHLAEYDGKLAGSVGDIATFSFYPGKNLGAMGDAGCILTSSDDYAKYLRLFRNHGSIKKYIHEIDGFNTRMNSFQAAILNIKLDYINKWNKKRLDAALYYNELLKNCNQLQIPKIGQKCKHVFHLYVIKAENRNKLMAHLDSCNIGVGLHYAEALPFMKIYNNNYKAEDFPIAFENQSKILSLPIFPDITKKQIEYVVDCIKHFYNNN